MSQSEEKIHYLTDKLNELWETGLHIIPGHYVVIKSKELSNIITGFVNAISSETKDSIIDDTSQDVILADKLNELFLAGLHIIPGHYVVVKSKELSNIIKGLYKNKERKAEF